MDMLPEGPGQTDGNSMPYRKACESCTLENGTPYACDRLPSAGMGVQAQSLGEGACEGWSVPQGSTKGIGGAHTGQTARPV